MKIPIIIAAILIVAGILGLAYGGFNYTKDTHTAELGPMSMSLDEKGHVNVPVWAGVGLIIAGGLLLLVRDKI